MRIREVMTRDVQVVGPGDSIRRAAQLMDNLNVGALPVCDGTRLVGMITDRDITVRATSVGKAPDSCPVSEVMTTSPYYCYEEDVVSDVTRLMQDQQIRRVPVVDGNRKLVGIVSLGDIATDVLRPQTTAETLEEISKPSRPDR